MKKLKSMRVNIEGMLHSRIASKDLALAMIGQIGTAGATGYAIEFTGAAVEAMTMEARMTLCNLAIEAGARCAMVAFDDTTAAHLKVNPWRRQVSDGMRLSVTGGRCIAMPELRSMLK